VVAGIGWHPARIREAEGQARPAMQARQAKAAGAVVRRAVRLVLAVPADREGQAKAFAPRYRFPPAARCAATL